MQCASHGPGANDLSIGQCLLDIGERRARQAKPNAPQAAGIVLRLHSTQPFDYLFRPVELRAGNLLVVEAIANDVRTFHHILHLSSFIDRFCD